MNSFTNLCNELQDAMNALAYELYDDTIEKDTTLIPSESPACTFWIEGMPEHKIVVRPFEVSHPAVGRLIEVQVDGEYLHCSPSSKMLLALMAT
jgi:hypothetical protein